MEDYMDACRRNGTKLFNPSSLPERKTRNSQLSSSQSRGAAFQNLGSTAYVQTSPRKQPRKNVDGRREVTGEVNGVSNGASSRLRSSKRVVDIADDSDSDELLLKMDSSPIGTPAKPVRRAHARDLSADGLEFHPDYLPKSLPSFKKDKKSDVAKPAPWKEPAVTSGPSKPQVRGRLNNESKTSSDVLEIEDDAPPASPPPKRRPRPAYRQPQPGSSKPLNIADEASGVAIDPTPKKSNVAARRRGPAPPQFPSVVSDTESTPRPKIRSRPQQRTIILDQGNTTRRGTGKGKGKQKESCRKICDPMPHPMAEVVQASRDRKEFNSDSEGDDSDSDPLTMTADEHLAVRGGPRPHPMAGPEFVPSGKPPSSSSVGSSKRASDSDDEKSRARRKRRIEAALALDVIDMSLTQEPLAEPSQLCPYCDQILPANPSPLLQKILKGARTSSYTDPRPTNPLGLKAAITVYIDICQRHNFETEQLPLAEAKGWPTYIDFHSLPKRIERLKDQLEKVIADKSSSSFWQELQAEIEEAGSRKALGLSGQYLAFDKSQPGYYGEQGAMVITQTLYSMIPLASLNASLIAPLPPSEFIQRVLVPETAVALIRDDMEVDRRKAIETLRDSRRYGISMFPTLEKGGVEDKIVKERAMQKRREIADEEERQSAPPSEAESRTSVKSKRSNASKGKASKKDAREVIEVSDSAAESSTSRASKRSSRASKTRTVSKKHSTITDSETDTKATEPTRPRPRHHSVLKLDFTDDDEATPRVSRHAVAPSDKGSELSASSQPLALAASRRKPPARSNSRTAWKFDMRDSDSDDASLDGHPKKTSAVKPVKRNGSQSTKTKDAHSWLLSSQSTPSD